MITGLARQLLAGTDRRALRKFVLSFGLKGMIAVHRFQRRIRQGRYFPAFLFLSVTNSCNLQCRGCWISPTRPPAELDLATIDRVITESKRLGTTSFGLLGGEPLLHEGLIEILHRHQDCYFLLFTNGTLLTEQVAVALRRAANVSPLISIEGREQVSDERRGGSQVFARAMAGLKSCRRQGLITGVATSVCKSNFAELVSEQFVDELAGLGVQYLWYYLYRPVGPDPAPELALDAAEVLALRRFLVEIRTRAPLLVVDSYWDHEGRALCPAAVGIGYHIGPGGHVEPCPPIQLASETVHEAGRTGTGIGELICGSPLLRSFRQTAVAAGRGCILMERPELLSELITTTGAVDSSGRGTVQAELAAMVARPSHHLPGQEIPEISWPYRFAKKNWFFGFGAYG